MTTYKFDIHVHTSWVSPANPVYLDGVEVFNGNPRQDSNNHLALAFAKKNKLKMLSGSDFHQKEDLALSGVVLSEVPSSSSELVRLLNEDSVVALLPEYSK